MSNDKKYDKATFDAVLAAVRGDNPEHSRATAKDKKRARDLLDAQGKYLQKKYNSKQHGGGGHDVIDSGMFDS